MLTDRRILITGGAGFIGSNLAIRLSSENEVYVLDDLSLGKTENLKEADVKLIKGSILDDSILDSLEDVDTVFHLAAIPGVQDSIDDPVGTSEINLIGTVKILEFARKKDVLSFVFASSCAIYGDTERIPIKESEPPNPLSPYATQKLASEYMVANYRELYGIKGVSARFFNVYGPRQSPDSEYSAVIPKFISRCLEGKEPIIYGSGKQTRDFVFVEDLVTALELIAERSPPVNALNIGSGKETSIKELAEIISEETGCALNPVYVEGRKGEINRSVADISLAKNILGWSPSHSLRDGIRKTVEYMRRS